MHAVISFRHARWRRLCRRPYEAVPRRSLCIHHIAVLQYEEALEPQEEETQTTRTLKRVTQVAVIVYPESSRHHRATSTYNERSNKENEPTMDSRQRNHWRPNAYSVDSKLPRVT